MNPDRLRELLEEAESSDRDKQGEAMTEITFTLGPLLAELWEAAAALRFIADGRISAGEREVDEALTALEDA